jgi:hypothetical protein
MESLPHPSQVLELFEKGDSTTFNQSYHDLRSRRRQMMMIAAQHFLLNLLNIPSLLSVAFDHQPLPKQQHYYLLLLLSPIHVPAQLNQLHQVQYALSNVF